MVQYMSFRGTVIAVEDFNTGEFGAGCSKMISLRNDEGVLTNFILTPDTFVLDQSMLMVGDIVTGYYDANKPAILIYPPQFTALVMVKEMNNRSVKVSHFNRQLVSDDHQLQINIGPRTSIITTNGQAISDHIGNRDLVVVYGPSTKSIPAQTTPYQIIVLCN